MEGWRQFVNEGYPNDDAQTPVDSGYENYELASAAKLAIEAFTDQLTEMGYYTLPKYDEAISALLAGNASAAANVIRAEVSDEDGGDRDGDLLNAMVGELEEEFEQLIASAGANRQVWVASQDKRQYYDDLHDAACKLNKKIYFDPVIGYNVLTKIYLLGRGWCCRNTCRHCPWRE